MTTIQYLNGEKVYNDQLNAMSYNVVNGWLTGVQVTESVIPAMSVDVSAGTVLINGFPVTVPAQAGVAIAASDVSFDRMDIVVVDNTATVSILTGTPSAIPKPTDVYDPAIYAILARVYVTNNATSILNADITDIRIPAGNPATAGGASVIIGANQAGCANGDVVRFDGTNYVPAQANAINTSQAVGLINNVSGGTGDVYLFGGVTFLSGLTPGTVYYLSAGTAGALISTRPAIAVKIGVATTATSLLVDIDRVTSSVTGGSFTQAFSGTSITVTHNLNTTSPMVQVYDNTNVLVIPDTITIVDANTVSCTFFTSTSGNIIVYSLAAPVTVDTGTSAQYVQTFASATSVTVTHNLNQQYVVVQAFDNTDAQIEPQTVTLTSSNSCTVTFGSATSGRIVVVGGSTFQSTAGDADLIPNINNVYNIGSSGSRWANEYLGGFLDIQGDVKTANGLESVKGGFGRILITGMVGDITIPPAQGFVGLQDTLDFDSATDETVYFSFPLPTDIDITQDIVCEITYCMSSANSSAAVVLQLASNVRVDGQLASGGPDNTSTQTITVPNTLAEYDFVTTTTLKIPSSVLVANSVLSNRFRRLGSNGSDTANGDFRLATFRLKYTRL